MSSNSRTSSDPPAKRAKVSHKSSNEVVDDVSISEKAPTMTGPAAADSAALEEEEGGEEEGENEKDGGELNQEDSTGRTKKLGTGSWQRCGVGGCDFKSKQTGHLKRHKANIHGVDVKWLKCDQCDFKSKNNSNLKTHKANVHGVDVKWFKCNQCVYKCKNNGHLKQHKAHVHGIDVKWFKCDQCA